jgi:hypothetical protein
LPHDWQNAAPKYLNFFSFLFGLMCYTLRPIEPGMPRSTFEHLLSKLGNYKLSRSWCSQGLGELSLTEGHSQCAFA